MASFTETQYFRQWWLWVILGISFLMIVSSFTAAHAWSSPGIWLLPIAIYLAVCLLLAIWRLDTRYDIDGIHYRVFPVLGWRTIRWSDVRHARVTSYFVLGYGIRWNFGEWVYNTAGNQGLRIQKTNGRIIILGTQRPDELRAFLQELPATPVVLS